MPALDGLRGVAILMVLMFHMQYPHTVPTLFSRVLHAAVGGGWAGVDLFFVLSGFLITGILLDSRESSSYYKAFFLRRIVRIFPLYYAVLVLWHFLGPAIACRSIDDVAYFRSDEPWLWAYLSNVRVAVASRWTGLDTSHFWSLALEEQFYLLWPFFVRNISRKHFLRTCLSLTLCVVLVRSGLRGLGVSSGVLYVQLPTRADALLIGASLATLLRDRPEVFRKDLAVRAAGMATVILLCGLGHAMWMHDISAVRGYSPFMQYGGYTLLAVLSGAAVVVAVRAPPEGATFRFLTTGLLPFLGKYSYGIYVFHFLLRGRIEHTFRPMIEAAGSSHTANLLLVVYCMTGIACSVLLALLSWNLLENPFLRLKSRFNYTP
jgi:peptidoglycan/LPS O-acetylase OafA/YrhL